MKGTAEEKKSDHNETTGQATWLIFCAVRLANKYTCLDMKYNDNSHYYQQLMLGYGSLIDTHENLHKVLAMLIF